VKTQSTERDLDISFSVITDFLGKDWIDKQLDKAKSKGTMEAHAMDRIHPLSKWLWTFERFKKRDPHAWGQLLDDFLILGRSIDLIRDQEGTDTIKADLQKSSKFYSTYAELQCMYFMYMQGYEIELVPTSRGKTPDIKAKKGNNYFYVECKSQNPLPKKTSKLNKILYQNFIYMKSEKRNSGLCRSIVVQSDSELSSKKIRNSINNCLQKDVGIIDLQSEQLGFEDLGPDAYPSASLTLGRMNEDLDEANLYKLWYIPKTTSQITYEKSEASGKPQNFFSFHIEYNETFSIEKSVIQKFDVARKQIPRGEPGIVFIKLERSLEESGQENVNAMKKRVEASFSNNQNTRISAVVIFTIHRHQDQVHTSNQVLIIENRNATKPANLSLRPLRA
jgi:hypothetical protein